MNQVPDIVVEAQLSAPAQTELSPSVFVGAPPPVIQGDEGIVSVPVVVPMGVQTVACRVCAAPIQYLSLLLELF